MKNILFVLFSIMLITNTIEAQIFSENKDTLKLNLQTFAEQKKSETLIKNVANFNTAIDETNIKANDIATIVQQLNKLTELSIKTTKEYNNYLHTVINLPENKLSEWLVVFQNEIDLSKRAFTKNLNDFLKFSVNFVDNNLLKSSAQRSWKIDYTSTNDYNFLVKDKMSQLSFSNVNLISFNSKDSLSIEKTNGTLNIQKAQWQGQGGKCNWKRGNWEEGNTVAKTAFVELENYEIDLKKPGFETQATLHLSEVLDNTQKGIFTNQLSAPKSGVVEYPRFVTNDKINKIDKIDEGIEFTGKLGLYGSKIQIKSDTLDNAKLLIKNNEGRKVLRANARLFSVTNTNKIVSPASEISVYFEGDSIYHPNLSIDFDLIDQRMRLVRSDKASAKIAFMNFYHKMELNTDALEWDLKEDQINFRATSQKDLVPVTSNSFNYFDRALVEKYRIELKKDPFLIFNNWVESTGDFMMAGDSFASQIGNFKVEDIQSVIFDLVKDGFIYYDSTTKMIEIRDKTRFYTRAYKDETDYDNIKIVSVSDSKNFTIDLASKDLLVEGVNELPISNPNQVALFPSDKNLTINKDRNIKAVGDLVASSVDFINGTYSLNYESFIIKLDSVQGMLFYFPLEEGKPTPIKTRINDVNGVLLVDELDNKSGRKNNADFPKLMVKDPSYVYFDSKKTCNGAYGREAFYFKIEPFSIRNLKKVTPKELNLPGEMFFGDIFPNIKQTISLQKDLTLGFDKLSAQANTPLYGNIAKFNGDINLTQKGLIPNGVFSYLTTKVKGTELLYLPKQMTGTADTLIMSKGTVEGVSFPSLYVGKPKINWLPYADTMLINKQGVVNAFDDKLKIKGELTLTAKGLSSSGELFNDYLFVESKQIKYSSINAQADTAKVSLNDPMTGEKLIKIDTTAVDFNLETDKVMFAPQKGQYVGLKKLEYLAETENLEWDGNRRMLTFTNTDKVGVLNSQIPSEDSLLINFKTAKFNVDNIKLDVSGIEGIRVADANIIPKKGKLSITPSTRIEKLSDATIKMGKTHAIEMAEVQIFSADKFEGSGQYVFDVPGLKKQYLSFDMIKTKEDVEVGKKGKRIRNGFYTVANTNIAETANFKLDPLMQYRGVVSFDSRIDSLSFEGYGKIKLSANIQPDWFEFKGDLTPENITIDTSNPIGEQKDTLQIGLSYSAGDYNLYPSFLTAKKSAKDYSVFGVKGKLNYDATQNMYQVGDSGRITYNNSVGQLLTLNDKTQTLTGNGQLNFIDNTGLLSYQVAGSFEHTIADSTTTFDDLLIALDFSFDEDLFDKKQRMLQNWASENKEIDFVKSNFDKAIPHLFDEKQAAIVLDDLEGKEYFERPNEDFNYKLFLANVDMVWDTLNRSFRSVGDFGLSYVGSKPINSECTGFVEFAPRPSGSQINIYLEFRDPDSNGDRAWIYYNYKNGLMEIVSSKLDFNQKISAIKEKKKLIVDKKTNETFQYALGSMNKANNFVIRMKESMPVGKEE